MPAQLSAVAARRAAQQANSHPPQIPPRSPNLQDNDQSTSQVAVSRKRKRRSRQAPTQETASGTAVVNILDVSNHDHSNPSANNSEATRTNSRQRDFDATEVLPEAGVLSRIGDDVQKIVLSSDDGTSDDAADSPREKASPDHPDLELHLCNFQPSADKVIPSSRQDWTVRLGEEGVRISPRMNEYFLSSVARLWHFLAYMTYG